MSRLPTARRGGEYYRIVAPEWMEPLDAAYSKAFGGRWNPPGEFGALYLNANVQVGAANARAQHAGRALKLFDLVPSARPELVTVDVPPLDVIDAASPAGIAALGFGEGFPFGVSWPQYQAIARKAKAAGITGVASRSNAEATPTRTVGEELAIFERVAIVQRDRRPFAAWYPDPIPG